MTEWKWLKYNMATRLKHIRAMRFAIYAIGGWPAEVLDEKLPPLHRIYRKFLLCKWSLSIFGQIYFLWINFNTLPFHILGHMFITTFLSMLSIARISVVNLKGYSILIRRFFYEFHLYNLKDRDGFYGKMYGTVNKISIYYTRYLLTTLYGTTILFNLAPLYSNFNMGFFDKNVETNGSIFYSVYYLFPGFDPSPYYYPVSIINLIASFECGVCICCFDLFMSLIVFQIIGHIKVLMNKLEVLPQPKNQALMKFDKEENEEIFHKLKDCVDHHRFIVSFTDNMSELFGPSLAIYNLFHLVCGCLLLLECSEGDLNTLTRYGTLTITLFGQLMQTSIVFEIIGHMSEKLMDSVYFVPWESMNTSNRRMVLFFLRRIQIPIKVTAIGVMPVGVQTMTAVLKTTFSYFMFLKSIDR